MAAPAGGAGPAHVQLHVQLPGAASAAAVSVPEKASIDQVLATAYGLQARLRARTCCVTSAD